MFTLRGGEILPMTLKRWDYQESAINATDGKVLNVGAANDWPNFRKRFGGKVVNTDIHRFLPGMDYLYSGTGEPDSADLYFDATVAPWPIEDDAYALVIMGEILEHISNLGAVTALKEARRVGHKLVVTCPLDWDFLGSEDPDAVAKGGAHISLITEEILGNLLSLAGWHVTDWQQVDYEFTPVGFFVTAERDREEYSHVPPEYMETPTDIFESPIKWKK